MATCRARLMFLPSQYQSGDFNYRYSNIKRWFICCNFQASQFFCDIGQTTGFDDRGLREVQ